MVLDILDYTAMTAICEYRDNDQAACDCCGEITRLNEQYQVIVEDDEAPEGKAEMTICGSCLADNKRNS